MKTGGYERYPTDNNPKTRPSKKSLERRSGINRLFSLQIIIIRHILNKNIKTHIKNIIMKKKIIISKF